MFPPLKAQELKAIATQDSEHPITVEAINDVWFLIVAGVAAIAYCVRLELNVKEVDRRIERLESEALPEIKREITGVQVETEKTMLEERRYCDMEFKTALDSQREFIAGQVALILEKVSHVKEQADRQGKEVRELRGYLRVKQQEWDEDD